MSSSGVRSYSGSNSFVTTFSVSPSTLRSIGRTALLPPPTGFFLREVTVAYKTQGLSKASMTINITGTNRELKRD